MTFEDAMSVVAAATAGIPEVYQLTAGRGEHAGTGVAVELFFPEHPGVLYELGLSLHKIAEYSAEHIRAEVQTVIRHTRDQLKGA